MSENYYQIYKNKTWPHAIAKLGYSRLLNAVKDAINLDYKYISNNGEWIWTNPFFNQERGQ